MSRTCRILKVSQNGFYKWLKNTPSKRKIEDMKLDFEIKVIWGKK